MMSIIRRRANREEDGEKCSEVLCKACQNYRIPDNSKGTSGINLVEEKDTVKQEYVSSSKKTHPTWLKK